MCKLKVSDFYYGAFLSAFLNNPRGLPSLFDETDARNIYRLDTNNSDNGYIFYVKYKTKKSADKKGRWHWSFSFSDSEIDTILELHKQPSQVKIALICVKDGFDDSELAIIDYEPAMDCLGVTAGVKQYKIDIKTTPGKHGLRMYGSGRSDKVNGVDNTLPVSRQELTQL